MTSKGQHLLLQPMQSLHIYQQEQKLILRVKTKSTIKSLCLKFPNLKLRERFYIHRKRMRFYQKLTSHPPFFVSLPRSRFQGRHATLSPPQRPTNRTFVGRERCVTILKTFAGETTIFSSNHPTGSLLH